MEAIRSDDTQGAHIELPAVSRRQRVRRCRCKQHGILHHAPDYLLPATVTRALCSFQLFPFHRSPSPSPHSFAPPVCGVVMRSCVAADDQHMAHPAAGRRAGRSSTANSRAAPLALWPRRALCTLMTALAVPQKSSGAPIGEERRVYPSVCSSVLLLGSSRHARVIPHVLCHRAAADGTPHGLALHCRPMRSGLRRAAQRPAGRLPAAIGGSKAVCCPPSWQAGLVHLPWICGMHLRCLLPVKMVCMPALCSIGSGQGRSFVDSHESGADPGVCASWHRSCAVVSCAQRCNVSV